MGTQDSRSLDENAVHSLYREMMDGWNKRNADTFASSFAEDGESIGFDGSQLTGRTEIASTIQRIFANHLTAPYITKVRSVRLLGSDVALLSAIAGMVPLGQSDIEPTLNAVQSLVAVRRDGIWRIALFQSTPAQLRGRPELVLQMTEELRKLLK